LVFILLSALTVWQLYDTKAELNHKLSAEHVKGLAMEQKVEDSADQTRALIAQVKSLGEQPVVTPEQIPVQGEPGVQGIPGISGPQGVQGIQGPIGPQGLRGPQGLHGLMGITGATGAQGEAGAAGPAGPQGDTGPQGPKGEQGAPGLVAVSVEDSCSTGDGYLAFVNLTYDPNTQTLILHCTRSSDGLVGLK